MIASPFLTAIKEAAQYLGKKLDATVAAIKSLGDKFDISGPINTQTRSLSTAVSRIETAIEKIKEPKFTGEVVIDTTALEEEMSGVADGIKSLAKKDLPKLDSIENLLKQVVAGLKAISPKETNDTLKEVTKILTTLKPLSTIKIDEMQFRGMAARGGSMPTTGGVLVARNVTQKNLTLASTATEYSYTFPANTTGWQVKLRDQGTLSYYSFTTGTLPTVGGGGDGTKYTTIPQNFVRGQENVDWSGKTMYFGSESANQVVEIESYQL